MEICFSPGFQTELSQGPNISGLRADHYDLVLKLDEQLPQ